MESRYYIDAKIGSGVRSEHALIPIDLQVDLNIGLHNSYTMKNIKLLSYSLSEREVSFIDKPSHGYNRKSYSERNLLNITIGKAEAFHY